MTDQTDAPETPMQRLARLAAKATPMKVSSAEIHEDGDFECAVCNGNGSTWGNSYVNMDGIALNIQFSGIGNEFGDNQRFVFALIDAYRAGELADANALDAAQAEIARLRAELEGADAMAGAAQAVLDYAKRKVAIARMMNDVVIPHWFDELTEALTAYRATASG